MVPDGPEVEHPTHPLQTVGLFVFVGVVFVLAVWGGIDLAWRVSGLLG